MTFFEIPFHAKNNVSKSFANKRKLICISLVYRRPYLDEENNMESEDHMISKSRVFSYSGMVMTGKRLR